MQVARIPKRNLDELRQLLSPPKPVMVTLHIWNCATKEEEAMAVERVRNELRPDGWRAGWDSFSSSGSAGG